MQRILKMLSTSISHIICGLGNPGREYETTRHNIGFEAVDKLCISLGCKVNKIRFKSLTGEAVIGGCKTLIMKPSTYMNNSGQAVVEAMGFYKIPPENIIIIQDDIALPVGKMRIRRKGSDGGQKGMRSIIYLSGSDNFPRIKIGVGAKPSPEWDLADWVLSRFSREEIKILEPILDNAAKAAELIISGDIETAMSMFN